MTEEIEPVLCAKKVVAISLNDYLAFGCPGCGLLPILALAEGWSLVNEFGDLGTCPKCSTIFVVAPKELYEDPAHIVIELADDCCKVDIPTRKGWRQSPETIGLTLSSHPRHGIPRVINADLTDPMQLEHGTVTAVSEAHLAEIAA